MAKTSFAALVSCKESEDEDCDLQITISRVIAAKVLWRWATPSLPSVYVFQMHFILENKQKSITNALHQKKKKICTPFEAVSLDGMLEYNAMQ